MMNQQQQQSQMITPPLPPVGNNAVNVSWYKVKNEKIRF